MPLPNGTIGVKKNPIIESPFIQSWDGEGVNPPPPGSFIRVTNSGENRVTNEDDLRITNSNE